LAVEHLKASYAPLVALGSDVVAPRHAALEEPRITKRYRLTLADEVRVVKQFVAAEMQANDEACCV
jgi:hypothetical protein